MKTKMKFYECKHCGNIIAFATDKGVKVVCCGEQMQEMVAGTVDASKEKHVPVVERNGNIVTVKVGAAAHPMVEEHYIGWIALETKMGNQRKELNHTGAPEAKFALLDGDEVVNVYAWCNLLGLWKA